ncbi:hypothetical protein PIB30_088526 [Stylosanthes scabra]|uniref:Uncharacterized protein n=1 Tax=Stylosanthes scabra TaxID=79078 RepID=A0ABU6RUM4_9FABA|nr:hypothetical protein [Stylosanthes scabra]
MRAQQQKTDKKRTEGEDENPEDDANGTESDTEEEEYHSADDFEETESETEEVQRERKSKRRQEESPEPEPEPQPQPEPEAAILFGPEPQEVIDGFVAACHEIEETEATIKACEEAELRYQQINQAELEKDNEAEVEIRKIIEVVVTDARELHERQEEAAPAPHKLDQPAPALMMVASVAAQAKEYDPSKAFDLGVGTPRQGETPEMYDLDDFPEEPETPITTAVPAPSAMQERPSSSEGHPHNRDLKERCLIWALSDRKDIKYDSIFMIDGDIHFEVVQKQFRSIRPGKEVDAAVITAYSLVLNNEPIPRFQTDVYILPPSALSSMMERYREDYIDLHTRKVHSITSLKSDEHLRLVNKDKLIMHRYWMYVLDKEKKTFFVVHSKRKDAPSSDRTRINKFAGNMIDQLLVYAGYHSLLTKGTRSKPPQISWFPRYQQIHEQPNARTDAYAS